MICPLCKAELTNKKIRDLTVCPGCQRTIAFEPIVASAAHTRDLSPEDIKALKQLRRVG